MMCVTAPNFADQADRYAWTDSLSGLTQLVRMSSWIDSVLAAEAIKAGIASEVTRLIIIINSYTKYNIKTYDM